ncbi:helix-turn-helix domain-containing protein [Megamonas hypermegale]|uniref:helix-turn-helix domain-containing protein n=1 Tax=Megamonas hypermegale TaxID=158847 RepID=UPI00195D4611|nr:helix-turn-helix transcriptional regulator [Megamonas hypermegale]MBM6761478.1 helix-turn-helix domain-containing protein [Megamonas hypermegale]
MFNENLKQARLKAGLSKASLARKLGLIYTTYDNYERGTVEPKVSTLCEIANVLNISTDELLGRTVVNKTEQLKNKIISALKHSNDKYFEIKNIDSGMITFTISNDDEKLTDVQYRTKDFAALVEMVENKYKNKIREDIYDLSSATLVQEALSSTTKKISNMAHRMSGETYFKEVEKYVLLASKLYELGNRLKEKSKKQENK